MTSIASACSLALVFLAASAVVSGSAPPELLQSMPEGPVLVRLGKKRVTVEYCPDNTCDVVRFTSKVPRQKALDLAAAYFFYGSRYEYLKDWQQDPALSRSIDARLRQHGHRQCLELQGKALARCEWTASEYALGLRVLYVRFDEGRKSVDMVPSKRAFN